MRKRIVATEGRTFLGLVAILTLCLGSGFVQTSDDVEREQEPTREIAIRAEQFSFTPNEIEVIEGETIQLILEAIDVPHGIAVVDLGLKIVAYPQQRTGGRRVSCRDARPISIHLTADSAAAGHLPRCRVY